jgi:hypothetical protein
VECSGGRGDRRPWSTSNRELAPIQRTMVRSWDQSRTLPLACNGAPSVWHSLMAWYNACTVRPALPSACSASVRREIICILSNESSPAGGALSTWQSSDGCNHYQASSETTWGTAGSEGKVRRAGDSHRLLFFEGLRVLLATTCTYTVHSNERSFVDRMGTNNATSLVLIPSNPYKCQLPLRPLSPHPTHTLFTLPLLYSSPYSQTHTTTCLLSSSTPPPPTPPPSPTPLTRSSGTAPSTGGTPASSPKL